MLPTTVNSTLSDVMPFVEGQEQFAVSMFDNAFSGFTSGFRYLRPKKMDFQISSGGNHIVVPNNQIIGVLLGVAPYNHCTWYERKYQPGMEPSQPDLLWVQKTPDTFPDALPAQYRKKVNVGGNERWDFRIARRTVWALATLDEKGYTLDTDNPVIFDMTSASMYGPSDQRTHNYKWSGMKQFCDQYSTPVMKCNPCMFLTQINIDVASPVTGVVVFHPLFREGRLAFIDNATYADVIRAAQSSTVADMLKITEILEYPKDVASTQTTAASSAQTAPVPPVQTATVPPVQAAHTAPAAAPEPAPAAPASEPAATGTPLRDDTPEVTMGMLQQAQSIMDARAAEPAPAAAAPNGSPRVSAAATQGIANIMGSLGDF